MTTGQSSSERFLYRSDLGQMPLPEVLVTIHRYKVPGVIECVRGSEIKKIFIDNGEIIFANSSEVADSLGDRLLAEGRITIEQYRESVRRLVREGGKRQGAILVEMRALEPKELFIAVRAQVRSILWSVFSWESGDVVFRPGRDAQAEGIKLSNPIPQAIIDGVLNVPDAKRLMARVGGKATLLERTGEAVPLTLEPTQKALLEAIDGKKTLFELTALPCNTPSVNGRLLYAFWTLRLVSVKVPKQIKVQVKVN
jgi:hypothetical protein